MSTPSWIFLFVQVVAILFQTATAQEFSYTRDFPLLQKKSLDPTDRLYYPKLLQRFQANDTTLTDREVLALLVGFTNDKHYDPYADMRISGRVFRLNADGKYGEALALADSFLTTHPVDQETLIEKSYALHKLGNEAEASHCLFRFRAIMKAMDHTGDGRSAAKAIFALGPVDGQNYIYKFLGWNVGRMGSGYDKGRHFLDILDAVSEDAKDTVTYYFNIDHAMSGFRKQLKGLHK